MFYTSFTLTQFYAPIYTYISVTLTFCTMCKCKWFILTPFYAAIYTYMHNTGPDQEIKPYLVSMARAIPTAPWRMDDRCTGIYKIVLGSRSLANTAAGN
jgi:hypothetical protein